MLKLNEITAKNLKSAIEYSIRFTRLLVLQEKKEILGETLIQLFRDVYLLSTGKLPQESLVHCNEEISLLINPENNDFLTALEKSLREEDDYSEFSQTIDLNRVGNLLIVLEKFLKTQV